MATLDNIFNPYERNRWYYAEEGESLDVCPISLCYLSGSQDISKTQTIYSKRIMKVVPKTVHENLKIKHYIKIGEECPICYNAIIQKRDAYLTECGHSFHLSCIYNYYYKNYLEKEGLIWCPICRQDMGDYSDLKKMYCNSKNIFDTLDDFWNTMEYEIPRDCNYNHFTGLNNNCTRCIEYRKCKK